MKKKLITAMLAVTLVSGCSAMSTAIKKRDLSVSSQMSETVWLDPVSQDKKTVYLQIKNTSGKEINITPSLSNALIQKGYTISTDPSQAHYWIQANLLKMAKMDLREAQGLLRSDYGSALIAGAALAGLASTQTSSSGTTLGFGLVGAATGFIADQMVEDVNYTLVTDVRIIEKMESEFTVNQSSNLKNGTSSENSATSTEKSNLKRIQTRVVSNANQVNLELDEAKPFLIDDLSKSISGIF